MFRVFCVKWMGGDSVIEQHPHLARFFICHAQHENTLNDGLRSRQSWMHGRCHPQTDRSKADQPGGQSAV